MLKDLDNNVFFNDDIVFVNEDSDNATGLVPATLLKKRLWHRCFPVNFVKFLRTPFIIEHLWWLLPQILPLWN